MLVLLSVQLNSDAITRQIGHYAYHVGQLVYIAKLRSTEDWKSLSIPRNQSLAYNTAKFAEEKQVKHFTNDREKGTTEPAA